MVSSTEAYIIGRDSYSVYFAGEVIAQAKGIQYIMTCVKLAPKIEEKNIYIMA